MNVRPLRIPDLVLIEPALHRDDRGWFMEVFHATRFGQALAALGLAPPRPFVQHNESSSRRGVLRGLHYQLPPHAQGKLVRVTQGAVFDVAVDVRAGSPTFGHWAGETLSAANRRQLWIPEGFAHGFVALEDDTRLQYGVTDLYAPDCERAIRWDDPAIGIDWPLPAPPILAAKDATAPRLRDAQTFA